MGVIAKKRIRILVVAFTPQLVLSIFGPSSIYKQFTNGDLVQFLYTLYN